MDELSRLEDIFTELERVLTNLKKNGPNRKYSLEYASSKRTYVENLHENYKKSYNKLLKILKSDQLETFAEKGFKEEKTVKEIFETLNQIQQKTQEIIEKDLEIQVESIQEQTTEMASFDIKTASHIIPDFDGESDKILDFLSAVKYYNDTLSEASKVLLMNFVINIKVKGKAKNSISGQNIKTYAELHKALSDRFECRKTVATLTQELAQSKQGNSSVTEYAEKIEKLSYELSKIQILAQNGENSSVIRAINDTIAASSFKNGLRTDLKTVVLAARAETFAENVSIAHEAESSLPKNTNQVNVVNSNGSHKQNSRGSRGQSGRGNRGRGNSRGNMRGNTNSQQRDNNYQSRGNHSNRRNNRNGRGNRYFRGQNRVYVAQEASTQGVAMSCPHGCNHGSQGGNVVAPGPIQQQPGAMHQNTHQFWQ